MPLALTIITTISSIILFLALVLFIRAILPYALILIAALALWAAVPSFHDVLLWTTPTVESHFP